MSKARHILATTGVVCLAALAVAAPTQIVTADAGWEASVVDAGRRLPP